MIISPEKGTMQQRNKISMIETHSKSLNGGMVNDYPKFKSGFSFSDAVKQISKP